MKPLQALTVTTLLTTSLLAGCASRPEPEPEPPARIGMPNPASAYCVQKGGKLSFQKDAAGHQTGLCALPDGTVIEEWALFRRDHPVGQTR
jgi:hypothetical protein